MPTFSHFRSETIFNARKCIKGTLYFTDGTGNAKYMHSKHVKLGNKLVKDRFSATSLK